MRHHHLPPHLSGGGFLPGPLKHAIPQSQGLELSPQSLGDQGENGHFFPWGPPLLVQPLEHWSKVCVLLLLPSPSCGVDLPELTADWGRHLHRRTSLLLAAQLLLTALPPFTVAAAILTAGASGEGVCISMAYPCPVHHTEAVGLQLLDPPCDLPFWLLERHEPLERGVVSPYSEAQATEVILEVAYSSNDGQQLATSDAVAAFSFVKCPAVIRHHPLPFRPLLCQHGAIANVTSVRVQDEGQGRVRRGEHRGFGESSLECLESRLAILCPHKLPVLL